MKKKVCAQCGGKLPLGVRFTNRWIKDGWKHLRFCSAYCEAINEHAHVQYVRQDRWIAYLGSVEGMPQNSNRTLRPSH